MTTVSAPSLPKMPKIPNVDSLGKSVIPSLPSVGSSIGSLSNISKIPNIPSIPSISSLPVLGGSLGSISSLASGGNLLNIGSGLSGIGGQFSSGLSGIGNQFSSGLSSLTSGFGNIGSSLDGLGSSVGGLFNGGGLGGLTSGLSGLGGSLGGLTSGLGGLGGLTGGLGGLGGLTGGLGGLSILTGGIGNIGSLTSGLGGLTGGLSGLGGLTSGLGGLSSLTGGLGGSPIGSISSISSISEDPMSLFEGDVGSLGGVPGLGASAVAAIYLQVLKEVSTKGKGILASQAKKYKMLKPFNYMNEVSSPADLPKMSSKDFDTLAGGGDIGSPNPDFDPQDWGNSSGDSSENQPASDNQTDPLAGQKVPATDDIQAGQPTADGSVEGQLTAYSSTGDAYTDSNTAKGLGFANNRLTSDTIAMSPEMIKSNGYKAGDVFKVQLPNGKTEYKYLGDTTQAGLSGKNRVDFYSPTMAGNPYKSMSGGKVSITRVESSGKVSGAKLEAVQNRVSQLNKGVG